MIPILSEGARFIPIGSPGSCGHQGVLGIASEKCQEDRIYLFCLATEIQATRLLRAWSRRNLIEQVFRILKHLLATDACQVQRRRLLRALGPSPDGELYPLLYEPGDLQGAGDDG